MPFVSDSFTDTDGTLLQDHDPEVGGAWQKLATNYNGVARGNATIQSNGLEDRSDMYRNATDPGSGDVVLEGEVTPWADGGNANSSNAYIHFLARLDDTDTAYGDVSCYMAGRSGDVAGSRGWAIRKLVNGTLTILASNDINFIDDPTTYTLRFEVEDEGSDVRLRLYIDDTLVHNVLDTSPITQVGRVGVNVGRENSRIESFAASALGAPEPLPAPTNLAGTYLSDPPRVGLTFDLPVGAAGFQVERDSVIIHGGP